MTKKRMVSLIISAAMLTAALPAFADNADSTPAKREYVISQFVQSVGRNNLPEGSNALSLCKDANEIDEQYYSDVERAVSNKIVTGYEDGSIKPKETITRLEALVILSRCVPVSDIGDEPIAFTDVPSWAKSSIDTLSRGGLVKGYGDGRLGADDKITIEQVSILTDRADAMLNTQTPNNNFYEYINNKAFRNAEINSSTEMKGNELYVQDSSWSYLSQNAVDTQEKENKLIEQLMNGELEYENGSSEQRIHDMLECMAAKEHYSQAEAGEFNSLKKKLLSAKTVDEFLDAVAVVYSKTGVNVLFDISAKADPKTHEVYPCVDFKPIINGGLIAFTDETNNDKYKSLYANAIKKHLSYGAGEFDDSDIMKAIDLQVATSKNINYLAMYSRALVMKSIANPSYTEEQLKSDLAGISSQHPEFIDGESFVDTSTWYKTYDRDGADKAIKNVKISEQLKKYGFTDVDNIILPSDNVLESESGIINKDNLIPLKINALLALDSEVNITASEAETASLLKFNYLNMSILMMNDYESIESSLKNFDAVDTDGEAEPMEEDPNSDWNLTALTELLPNDLGIMYCNYHHKEETTDNVGEKFLAIRNKYKEKFETAEWLTPQAREMAAKKMANMWAVVGYPDNYDFPTIVSIEDGGTYFKNFVNIKKHELATVIKSCNESDFMRSEMTVEPDVSLISYVYDLNTVCIPAGAMKYPIYDENADYAVNLGGIGAFIAHEIAKAMDETGAEYDEYGCRKSWWTDEDKTLFDNCKKEFHDYFTYFDKMCGVEDTTDEAFFEKMADIIGIQIIMGMVGDNKDDQKKALESYARTFARLGSEAYLNDYTYASETHESAAARINASVASLDCFYEIYGIDSTDAMYIAPDKRLKVW